MQNYYTILGITVDTSLFICGIDEKKFKQYNEYIDKILKQHTLAQKELEKLAGYLAWVAQLLFQGKAFLRCLYEKLNSFADNIQII